MSLNKGYIFWASGKSATIQAEHPRVCSELNFHIFVGERLI